MQAAELSPRKCPGCDSGPFSLKGFTSHLAQSADSRCVTVRELHLRQSLGAPDSQLPLLPPVDLDAPPILFGGDFFGNYEAGDFPEQTDGNAATAPPLPLSNSDSLLGPSPLSNPCPSASQGAPVPPAAQQDASNRTELLKTYVVRFPGASAGAAVPDGKVKTDPTYAHYRASVEESSASNPYAPFKSETDWLVARWAKLRGAGSTSFSDLLAIQGIAERLALSYKNSRELNAIIDKLPTGRPRFQREEIMIAGEAFEVYFRDIIECIRSLLGDPEFAPLLLLVPEEHYTDASKSVRVYFDMNTGKWWWATQEILEKERPGATVIPVIISSDKTQLTLIGNKSAYPVYMTLGNLPKDVRCKPSRRGQILLAYLPTSRLLHISKTQNLLEPPGSVWILPKRGPQILSSVQTSR